MSNQAIGHIMTPEVVVARTPPLLSKYLRKYVIKKPNQIALLSTGDPIHCVVTSQTKYSEPLNLVVYFLSIAHMEHASREKKLPMVIFLIFVHKNVYTLDSKRSKSAH